MNRKNSRTLTMILVFISLFGVFKCNAQTNSFVSQIDSVVRIGEKNRPKPRMGFVIKRDYVLTIATDHAHIGDPIAVVFQAILRGPSRRINVHEIEKQGTIAGIDSSAMLIAVDTGNAKPAKLASEAAGETLYWYVKIKNPTRMKYGGADTSYADTTYNPGNQFQSIPGSPVTNTKGAVVGITTAVCDANQKNWRECIMSLKRIDRLLRQKEERYQEHVKKLVLPIPAPRIFNALHS